MKNEELIALALAGIALWMIIRSGKAGASVPADYSTAIANQAKPGEVGYGWQYFTGGTVIDPDGAYWKDGRIVWAPGLDASW